MSQGNREFLSSASSKDKRLTVVALERKHSTEEGVVGGKDGPGLGRKEGHRHIIPPPHTHTPGEGFLEALEAFMF